MALRKLVRSNCGGKSPVSIKYENLHSFKEGMILLCLSILKTRRKSHLPGSAHFKIPLRLSKPKADIFVRFEMNGKSNKAGVFSK